MQVTRWMRRNRTLSAIAVLGALVALVLLVFAVRLQGMPGGGNLLGTDGSGGTFYRAFHGTFGNNSSAGPGLSELVLLPYNKMDRALGAADGASLPVDQNTALFALLGTDYGGDGHTFNLPDLTGKAPSGMYYRIRLRGGSFPEIDRVPQAGASGDIKYFEGNLDDRLWGEIVLGKDVNETAVAATLLPADGRVLESQNYQALYSLIGDSFGSSTSPAGFKLPNLSGVSSPVPGAKYYIVIQGSYPAA